MNRIAGILFAFFFVATAFAQSSTYVGAERCRTCHKKAYETWIQSGHAKAQANLPGDKRSELGCLFCHATDVQQQLKEYRFSNVQCEACHGPGSTHVRLASQNVKKNSPPGGLAPISEGRCRDCHSDVRSAALRPFQYDEAVSAIRHW